MDSVFNRIVTDLYKYDPDEKENSALHDKVKTECLTPGSPLFTCLRLMQKNSTNKKEDLESLQRIYEDPEVFDVSSANITIGFMTQLPGYDIYRKFLEFPGETREEVYSCALVLPHDVFSLQGLFQIMRKNARRYETTCTITYSFLLYLFTGLRDFFKLNCIPKLINLIHVVLRNQLVLLPLDLM